ncbi:MAG: hypothetical protein VW380_02420, partial [Candidatus Woesearchaeota archaeon]
SLDFFNQAIALNPTFAATYFDLANLFEERKLYDDALTVYDRLISLMPKNTDAYIYKGNLLHSIDRYSEELDNYDKAIDLGLNVKLILGRKLRSLMYLNDWENFDSLVEEIINQTNLGLAVANPFTLLSVIDNPALIKKSVEQYTNFINPNKNVITSIEKVKKHKKISIAFFSSDFYDHAIMHLISDVLQNLDRDRFKYIGVSFSPVTDDQGHNIAKNAFEEFVHISYETDEEIIKLSKEMKIDIAVDLNGYTANNRSTIFAHRIAPIQINYLGFPATMGANYYDYIIADKTIIPAEQKKFYTEKVIYLPNCYQPNQKKLKISSKNFTKKEFGLPDNGFIYCCFNSNSKITPRIFDLWMRILCEVKGSVLWLLKTNEKSTRNLLKEAEKRKINPGRIIFAPPLPIDLHLKRISYADLFLDTFPYNAHTTSSDSLRMNVPVITLCGETFSSRVAASLLTSLNMDELITYNEQSYKNLAIKLGTERDEFKKIRKSLHQNLKLTSLFDPKLFARDLESIFENIYSNL